MNKISKKIVALVTMAAFVLTLVPFAAFAAAGDVQTSTYKVVDGNVKVDVDDVVATQFIINDETGIQAGEAIANVKVWATDKQGRVTTAAVFTSDKEGTSALSKPGGATENVYNVASASNNLKVYVKFTRAGEYTIHAGVGNYSTLQDVTKLDELNYDENANTITVDPTNVVTEYIQINSETAIQNNGEVTISDKTTITNGIDTADVTVTAYQANGDATGDPAVGETFSVSTNSDKISVNKDSFTTDNEGKFTFKYSLDAAGEYRVYLTNEDIAVTINIDATNVKIQDIETSVNNAKTLLAGDDRNYAKNSYQYLSDAVQFEITDQNGDAIPGGILGNNNEPAAKFDAAKHSSYLSIKSKPADSDLESGDLRLGWDPAKEVYTLVYNTSANDAKDDLVAGEYTVEVSLLSGAHATATFTLANYGTTKDLVLDVQAKAPNASDYVDVTDEVLNGSELKAVAKYVDENGIEINATGDVQYGINGRAVTNTVTAGTTKLGSEDSYIGTIVTVKAFDDTVKKYVEQKLTVVDAYNEYTLAFDKENGPVNETNKVAVSVVDDNGKVANVTGDVYAYVDTKSVEDANVQVTADNNVAKGKGEITLFSNKETTADVVVVVKTDDGHIYGNTLSYTFGEEDVNANTSVVMTIGSSDMVVDNEVVAGDAAPYVADSRTMVPIRVLSETFGADVDYDDATSTVTIVDGDTTIVMTIGETTYTVNGEEQTMDVAPVIGSGDRTYVPVRFVAEALGYKVTPLYAADGTTASVVFQK